MKPKKSPADLHMQNADDGIPRIPTGVAGLDTILHGGLPAFSFNLLAGGPGSGKTTLSQQIVFRNATPERPALCFTILGEPTLKILRYQQMMKFFDPSMVGNAVRYLNLSEETLSDDLQVVLDRIVMEVETAKPGIVVVDSFRTLQDQQRMGRPGMMDLDQFVQRLSLHLTTWEITSFLIGEYTQVDQRSPVFTVADGVLWLSQSVDRSAVVRKLQVVKSRGHPSMPGLHTFRITADGLQIFPRLPELKLGPRPVTDRKLSTGVPGLDEMMGGGIPAGDALMVAGPAGSGKTTLATQFVGAGFEDNEPAVIVVFEEYPDEYLARASARSSTLRALRDAGNLTMVYLRPFSLSIDEMMHDVLESVRTTGARRLVIDSLSGLEISLAPSDREDFRESLYRLVGTLTAAGVTVLVTAETTRGEEGPSFTTQKISFITDDLIVLRFVEADLALHTMLAVIKMRGSAHSRELRPYVLDEHGASVLYGKSARSRNSGKWGKSIKPTRTSKSIKSIKSAPMKAIKAIKSVKRNTQAKRRK